MGTQALIRRVDLGEIKCAACGGAGSFTGFARLAHVALRPVRRQGRRRHNYPGDRLIAMTDAGGSDGATLIGTLKRPERLWTRAEVLAQPSPVPPVPGVYGWHFTAAPNPGLDAGRLLYVGIAPRHMANRTSSQHLRKRIRYHYRGNAYGSTLRLTLGCLLGLELRRVGSGTRLTFGTAGEASLSEWMHEHARVCWYPTDQPWLIESEAIGRLDLPLNLDQNRNHPFHRQLTELRAEARVRAREQPVLHL